MWQRFHVLSRTQVFIVASVSAAAIASAVALASIPADGVSWNRFLGPSRQLDPFINFGAVFVSVLPPFIAYYHLARVGAMLGIVASAATFYAIQVCAGFIFVFQVVGHSWVLKGITYVTVWLLISTFILWAHLKASNSHAVRDAQRLLRLAA